MEVSGSSVVLPEVTVKKDEENDKNTSELDAISASSPIVSAAEQPQTTVAAESAGVLEERRKNNSQQGITEVEGMDIAEEKELKDGKLDQPNGLMDFDLLDLIANPAERVKSNAMSRKRKQVDLFVFSVPEEKPPIVIAKGQGCKLGEIPSIETQIDKRPYSDLIRLHRFLFGKGGSHEEIKNNLKLFSGFPFTKESDDYKKKREVLIKMNEIVRDLLCDCLTLGREDATDIMDENLMSFLLKPASTSEVLIRPLAATAERTENSELGEGESAAATSKQGDSMSAISEQRESTETSCKPEESTSCSEEGESVSVTAGQGAPVAKPKKQGKAKAATSRKPKVAPAKLDPVETKPPAGKSRKAKPKADKENSKPVKDPDGPPKRKRKAFMAPVSDKSQTAKQIKLTTKATTLSTITPAE